MTEIDIRSPENLPDRPQQSVELGSPSFRFDRSKTSKIMDEGYAEEDEGRRKEDSPSNLINQKHQIKSVQQTENSESALPGPGLGSDHVPGRPMAEIEQDEKKNRGVEASVVNHSEIQVNGANDNKNSDSALPGLQTDLPPLSLIIDDQEEGENQQAENYHKEDGAIPEYKANADRSNGDLARKPELNAEGYLVAEKGEAGERATEFEVSHLDMEVSQANGSSSPLPTQNREIGPSSERELKKQNEHRNGPELGSSHVEITSHANGTAHSKVLPKTPAFDSTSNSNLDQQNTNEDKLATTKSETRADGNAVPRPLAGAPQLGSVGIPNIVNHDDIGGADSTEGDLVDASKLPTSIVQNTSPNQPPVQVRDHVESSLPIHVTNLEISRQRISTPERKPKRAKLCSCFGESDRDHHHEAPARVKKEEDIPLTTRNDIPANGVNSIREPTYAPPNVPSPDRLPPNAPAPTYAPPRVPEPASATKAHLIPDRASSPNHLSAASSLYDAPSPHAKTPSQQSLYTKRLARFSPWSDTTQSGSETDRDSVVIAEENAKVAELQEAVYNNHTKLYIARFQETEQEQDATYKAWKDEKKRDQLLDFIQRKIGDPEIHNMTKKLWYVHYLKVSKDKQGPWESVVLIGCDQEHDCRILNRELEHEKNSQSWFLKNYTCRAEIGRGITLCAVGSTASHSGQEILGTRIYGQDMKSVPTLCGQLCHIRGPNEVSGSLCTMGGVLNINQDFYVLTSAHPFRQETRNPDRPDNSSKEQIGLLSGYKLDAPTITAEKSTGLASDWALIALEDQYIKPNTIQLDGTKKLIPITGYLPTKYLTAGKVWVCTSRGAQLGALVQNPTIMGMGGNVFETRGIRLENELIDGDSGSWVVRNGKLCGLIIGRTVGEAWAYMLPIELVFEDIREYMKATRNVEVSNPQTWLGGATTNDTVEGTSKIGALGKDNPLLDIQEPAKSENAQEEPHVAPVEGRAKIEAIRNDEPLLDTQEPKQSQNPQKKPDVSVENLKHSSFQSSISSAPSIVEDQPSEPHRKASTSSTPPLWSGPKEPPSQKSELREMPEGVSLPDRDSSLPASQGLFYSNFPRGSRSKTLAIHDDDLVVATEEDSLFDRGAKMPEISPRDSEGIELQTIMGEMSSKPDAKQDEKQKSPEKLPSNKISRKPTFHDLDLERVRRRAKRHNTFSSEVSSADRLDDRDSPVRHDLFIPLHVGETEDLLNLLKSRQGARATQIVQNILTEVVLFSDLMSQVLGVPSTEQDPFAWRGGIYDLLISKVGLVKTTLITQILNEEVRLIQDVFKHKDGLNNKWTNFFRIDRSRTFVWKPLISELAFNKLRLKRLVESQPLPAPELPAKDTGVLYDCTPQLELFRALSPPLNARNEILWVGLAVPNFWISGHDESGIEPEQLVINRRTRYDEGYEGHSRPLWLEWWSIERFADGANIDNAPRGLASDIFERQREFVAPIENIDGSVHQVFFRALPQSDAPSTFVSYQETVERFSKFPRHARLQTALGIGVGMIFLSPTPWYSADSNPLQEKLFFLGNDLNPFEHVIFAQTRARLPSWGHYANIPEMGSILIEFGLVLIELALHRIIFKEEKHKSRLSHLARSGLVAMEMGVEYQDIVNICLTQKYENSSGVVTEIDESLASFREHANEAIIVPLRALWLKSKGESTTRAGKKNVAIRGEVSEAAGKAKASSMEIVPARWRR